MTTFDPTAFLSATITSANSTEMTPVPVGEYTAIAEKVELSQWQKKDDPTVTGLKLRVTWAIQDEALKAQLSREKVTVPQDIMLDMSDSGQLATDEGKNVALGRLRAAVDLNQAGQPFNFLMLQGRMAKISVTHNLYKEQVYAGVKTVAKL